MIRAAVLFLAILAAVQDDDPSFAPDQRLAAAHYAPGPDARPAVELAEMAKVGVDIALIPFRGDSKELDPLVSALDDLEKDRKARPRLAPFLQPGAPPDFGALDAFTARVPARHAARIDGRPVLWLAPAPKGATVDRATFSAAIGRLQRPPYVVAEVSWKDAPADRTYASGALRGFALDLPVVTVGPGSGDREDGRIYERAWYKAIRLEPRMVVLESWNGADGVSETPERKRKYLDLTHRFIRDYKVNEKFTLPKGKFTAEKHVAYTIAYTPHEQGLKPVPVEDGLIEEVRLRGFEALTTKENKKGTVRRICFDVDDSFCYFEKRAFEIIVDFFDQGEGAFSLEYDSADRTLSAEQRVVKTAGQIRFTNTGQWRMEGFKVVDAAFGNGQPGGADFRFSVDQRGLSIRTVMVMKR